MKILGIDPGYERLGIAVIEKNGKEELLHSECFKTSAKLPHAQRLHMIGEKIFSLIEQYEPETLAIEKLFFNTNSTTALGVAEARGVVLYTAAAHGMRICEYTPLQIKMAITSYGRSDKKQIMAMIPRLIDIKKKILSDDEFDAIACALTCAAVDPVLIRQGVDPVTRERQGVEKLS